MRKPDRNTRADSNVDIAFDDCGGGAGGSVDGVLVSDGRTPPRGGASKIGLRQDGHRVSRSFMAHLI